MRFDLPRAVGLLGLLILLGVGGLAGSGVMAVQTVLMMVLPSMILFAAVAFWVGMKHGEFRAHQ